MIADQGKERVLIVTYTEVAEPNRWEDRFNRILTEAGYEVQLSTDRSPGQLAGATDELKAVVLDADFFGQDRIDTRPLADRVRSFRDELGRGEARQALVLVTCFIPSELRGRDLFVIGKVTDIFEKSWHREQMIQDLAPNLPRVARLTPG